MLVEKAIVSLLKFSNRVTIPGLGSIIKQADFSQAVFFNQFIRFDDGVLRTHLTKVEGYSPESVEQEIHDFTDRVNQAITITGFCEVIGVGYFIRQNGRIELVSDRGSVPATTENIHTFSEIIPSHNQEFVTEDPPIAGNGEKDLNDLNDLNDLKIPALEFEEETEVEEWEQPPVPIIAQRRKDSTRKSRSLIAVAVILTISVGVSFIYFFNSSNDSILENQVNTPEPASKSIEQTDSITTASSAISDEKEDTETEVVADSVSNTRQPAYHIVIGSFKVESNADRFTSMVNDSGMPAIKVARSKSFYLVSCGSHPDLRSAIQNCKVLRRQYDGAWIFQLN